ncbi:MAG: DUF1697 domain-containing protein [Candidatus Saccharimonadales bacterium]|jgi:uncharacterized protein (DUF1697 family)
MKYVALLRGINAGGNRRVPMAELREIFTDMGFTDVTTYINSGNVVFSAQSKPSAEVIRKKLEATFQFEIPLLVLSAEHIRRIAEAIPKEWQNDTVQKSDVIYLFPDIDSPDIINSIGYRPEFETIHYVSGALISNGTRENRPKSSLVKLIGTPLYRRMTIRNVTTARKLAELVQ